MVESNFILNKGPILLIRWKNEKDKPIDYISPNVSDILGYSQQEFLSGKINFFQLIPTEDFEKARREANHYKETETDSYYHTPYRVRKKNGEIIWVQDYTTVIRDTSGKITHFLAFIVDVTHLKEVEEELRKSKKKFQEMATLFRLMTDNIPDLVWAKDLKGRYIFVNKATCEKLLIAKDIEEPIGKTDIFFSERQKRLHPENKNWHTFGELCVNSDQIVLKEKKAMRFDEFGYVQGKFLFLDVYKAPIFDENGEIIGTVGHGRIVTKEKKIEEELKINEERLSLALEGADLGLWDWDINTGHLFVTEKFIKIFNYDPNKIHMNILTWKELVHPEDLPMVMEKLEKHFKGETDIYQAEYRIKTGKENWRWILVRGKIVKRDEQGNPLRAVGTAFDISEKKEAEIKLKESEENLRTILTSMGDGVIATDKNDRVILINPVAEKLTGWHQNDILNLQLKEILKVEKNHFGEDLCNIYDKEISTPIRCKLISKNRKKIDIEITAVSLKDFTGKTRGKVFIFRDIRDKLKREEEILKNQKLELLGLLAGGIAHDFNNLLAGIFGNIDLAKYKLDKSHPSFSHIETAEKALEAAVNMTKQLLMLSKESIPLLETINIKKILIQTAKFNLSGSKVKPDFRIEENLWHIKADKGQITQAIANLVINAKQAMPEGGKIKIKAFNTTNPDRDLKGNFVKILISDQGIGIKKENLEKIFEPYFTTKSTGTGLGLSIVHKIISKHGGKISVESEEGKGTTFTILLPAETKKEAVKEEKNGRKQKKVKISPKKILVMDDEEDILEVMTEILESYNHKVDTALNGKEALEKLKKALKNQPYDLIIMDLTIPGGMGGKEIINRVHEIQPDIKTIVSSGYPNDPLMVNYKDYGFHAKLTKPFKIKTIEDILTTLFSE